MKRILCVFLAALCLMALCGCGERGDVMFSSKTEMQAALQGRYVYADEIYEAYAAQSSEDVTERNYRNMWELIGEAIASRISRREVIIDGRNMTFLSYDEDGELMIEENGARPLKLRPRRGCFVQPFVTTWLVSEDEDGRTVLVNALYPDTVLTKIG